MLLCLRRLCLSRRACTWVAYVNLNIKRNDDDDEHIWSQADGRPPCINGHIAIQWKWSNFDPTRNQNPLTDYDKTLHNWLCLQDEHVSQNVWQSTLRERLGKYVKYKALFF